MNIGLKIGTRGDALGVARAQPVASALGAEIVIIASEVDRSSSSRSLEGLDSSVDALRDAILTGEVDAVVHAYSDLPVALTGRSIAAVPRRADVRDALYAHDGTPLAELPPGSRVGAGSPLRRAQLLSRRSDLEVVELLGNAEYGLGQVDSNGAERHLDAVVLAAADLDVLGRLDAATEYLGIDGWPTSPAQGAIAIETRVGDEKLVSKLDHKSSRLTADAERAVLALLEGHRVAPIGAHAILDDGLLFLSARAYRDDGSEQLTSSHALYPEDSSDPVGELSRRVADELLAGGASGFAQ
ncbi:MAG: hydroxymethylbilane synthase [Pseudolysinimonas sp.]